MGWYGKHVLPRLIDLGLSGPMVGSYRKRACAGLTGRVMELGFGSGANLPFLPAGVTEVLAVDPSETAWARAERRIDEHAIPVRRIGDDAADLDLASGSVDAVLSTWTLCTVAQVESALQEARRVLVPGGALHLVEHGLSPHPSVARWQRRLNGLEQRLVGGCQLSRDLPALMAAAGFQTGTLQHGYAVSWPPARPWVWFSTGMAAVPAGQAGERTSSPR